MSSGINEMKRRTKDKGNSTKVLKMPASRSAVDSTPTRQDGSPAGEPAQVIILPRHRRYPRKPPLYRDEIADMSADEKKFACADILMARSEDKRKLDSLYYALPADLQARALIELVIGTALAL
jgi:hypothetical protein